MRKAGVVPVLLLTALISLVAMTVYELTKQLLWPDVSIWKSHAITILVVSVFITGLVYFAIRDRQKQLTRIVKTMQQRGELEHRLRKSEAKKDLVIKILQAQKHESLGVLAGGIAHDFNNLLVGILGNADLALSELDRGVSPRRTVKNIKQSSLRAADLTNQMLAFSGKGSFIVKPLNLNDLILNMTRLQKAALGPKTKIRFEMGENLPDIEGDEMQLRQVVMNLIVNAAEAVGKQTGEILLCTSQEHFTQEELEAPHVGDFVSAGTYLVLEVTDNGCGMDEETREKLFDPFFTTKFPGRGLGLAAVLGIVRGHGGAIFVTSKPGAGSTFRVLLPTEAPEEAFHPGKRQSQ